MELSNQHLTLGLGLILVIVAYVAWKLTQVEAKIANSTPTGLKDKIAGLKGKIAGAFDGMSREISDLEQKMDDHATHSSVHALENAAYVLSGINPHLISDILTAATNKKIITNMGGPEIDEINTELAKIAPLINSLSHSDVQSIKSGNPDTDSIRLKIRKSGINPYVLMNTPVYSYMYGPTSSDW